MKLFLNAQTNLLDVGSGAEGTMLKDLSPYIKAGVGIDLRAEPYEEGNIKIQQVEFDEKPLPFADSSFDCVSLLATLEHMNRRVELLEEIRRVLKPGGVLIITVPTWAAKPILEFLAFRLKIVSDVGVKEHKTYFWKAELVEALKKAGFSPEQTTVNYFELGFNLSAVARK
jgi:SAM-dependent methyltransferase